ncbi:MAG: amidohydrolase family protein, partial [SAR324 cluster bacterium]|nr:amidohydrolase family protein [SAR324 cluster bacterium]
MTTLYSGGLVFDGKGNLLENHGVLVDGERISRIAPIGEFEGYSSEKIDTSAGTLLPGLIDCHVHLVYCGEADPKTSLLKLGPGQIVMNAFENAQKTIRSGITAIRDLGGRDYLEFAVRDACNSGRQLGPTIMAAGKMICMTGGHGNVFGRIADGPDEVLKAVREQIQAGSDVIKLMATGGVMTPGVNPEDAHYTEEELRVGVDEGHRFHRTCASHAQGAAGILNAVRAGMDSIEHGIFMTQECLEAMLEKGTYLVPTLAAVNNIYLNRDNGIPAFIVEKTIRVRERHHQSIKMFYKAGGKIAMGTDAGTPFNIHGDNCQELQYMVDLG